MEIFLSTKANKQLSKIPFKMHDLLVSRIMSLSKNPFGPNSKKLKNRQGWRYRVGDYRILYTVEKKKLIILSVAHRREAYKIR